MDGIDEWFEVERIRGTAARSGERLRQDKRDVMVALNAPPRVVAENYGFVLEAPRQDEQAIANA